jgi:hypothetical protein
VGNPAWETYRLLDALGPKPASPQINRRSASTSYGHAGRIGLGRLVPTADLRPFGMARRIPRLMGLLIHPNKCRMAVSQSWGGR